MFRRSCARATTALMTLAGVFAACDRSRPAPSPQATLTQSPVPLSPVQASTTSEAGWTRQASIWIRGNDGSTPGEQLRVGQSTRIVAWVSVGKGPPGQGPRGMVADLPNTRLRWRSSAPDIASVDSTGRITARRAGTAFAVATAQALDSTARIAQGIRDSMPIVVRPADPRLDGLQFENVDAPATSDAHFTCGTVADGRVLCWGNTFTSMDSLAAPADSLGPLWIAHAPRSAPVRSIGTGLGFLCELTNEGEILCWGVNRWGQLGTGSRKNESSPTPVAGNHTFLKLSVGRSRSCAITSEHRLFCWGSGVNEALGASTQDRCAFDVISNHETLTRHWPCSVTPLAIELDADVKDVAVGDDHACALTTTGSLYCWGYVYNNDFKAQRPTEIRSDVRFESLASGSRHVCGLDKDGRAYCWGRNWVGQLGGTAPREGSRELIPVTAGVRFRVLALGDDHTCGLTPDGDAYCWGYNSDAQTGTNSREEQVNRPARVRGGLHFKAVTAGASHTCAVTTTGGLYCWGTSLAVRPDLGTLKEEPEPFHIAGPR